MAVRNKTIQVCQWDRFPRARTALSLALLLPVVAMCLLMSMSLPLRYGPYLLCLVAVSAVIARPCNRATVVALGGPMAMGLLGMIFIAIALPQYTALATVAAIWRRAAGAPYGRTVWPDFPPGRLRRVAVATTIACGIVCVWLLVIELR